MRIGIIGAGNIGATLTRKLAALGHEVSVANSRGPDTLAELATETGARATLITEVAHDADVLFVAIPFKRVADLPGGIFDRLPASAVLVDTGNYVPRQRDGKIDEIEAGLPESRWTERKVGHPVVKAFNTIKAASLATRGEPAGTPGRIAIPVAGDDPKARAIVMDLADQLGYDAIDAGGLDESWRQQPGTPVYTADLDRDRARKALADASPQRPAAWRA